MLVMINDGGVLPEEVPEDIPDDNPGRVLLQRMLVFFVISQGVSVALMEGAEFRDSKVRCLFAERLCN